MSNQDFSHLTHLRFEDAHAKLEKIVEQLETNSLPLDESLALFEEGQQLSAYCQQLLDKAELRVNRLINGELEIKTEETVQAEATPVANNPATPDEMPSSETIPPEAS